MKHKLPLSALTVLAPLCFSPASHPATYKVDARRVYAAGFSNGAWFTYVLLTAEPERFAAFVPIDGCLELFIKWGSTPRPVLVITDSGGCGGRPVYEQEQLIWMRHL